tara:strand:+ start:1381 stop:1506 length:126 start_codon:yes stop_codon:yes gene_type:complete
LLAGWLKGDALELTVDSLTVPTGPGLGVPLDQQAEGILEAV